MSVEQIPVTDECVASALQALRNEVSIWQLEEFPLAGGDVLRIMAGLGLCSQEQANEAMEAAGRRQEAEGWERGTAPMEPDEAEAYERAAAALDASPPWQTSADATPRAHHDQTVHRIWGTEPRPIPLTEDAWGDWRAPTQEFEPYRLPPFLAATLRGDAAPAHDWSTTIFSALVIAGAVAVLIYLHAQ